MYRLQPDGSIDPSNRGYDNFYGEWREGTKGRWLQQAWWRYLQARWGYSVNIHSWELINEGDPVSTRHYTLTDELGKYMHCRVFNVPVGSGDAEECEFDHPNAHMVSTSFWHSFPAWEFWAHQNYPNVDYADVHAYISTGWLDDPDHEADAAAYHLDYSQDVRERVNQPLGGKPTMPVIRGEAGIDFVNEQTEQPDLEQDLFGVWLHNFVWASLDANALIEEYWWTDNLENQPGPDGNPGLHEIFGYFSNFIQDVPLNNGNFQDAAVTTNDPNMRVIGQKDVLNDCAILWVQNRNHTWRNIVEGMPNSSGLSGTLTLDGFSPNTSLSIEWHEFTTQGVPSIHYSTVTTSGTGGIVLPLPSDPQITDVGIKIGLP
jgi:hypothetical protein